MSRRQVVMVGRGGVVFCAAEICLGRFWSFERFREQAKNWL